MIVWVSGPTGGGKSSIARALQGLGYAVLAEDPPEGPFARFRADAAAGCAAFQEAMMRARFERWAGLPADQRGAVVFDRSVDEDIEVFCALYRELGLLDAAQRRRLRALAAELQAALPRPDLIVHMAPGRQALAERVTEATHPWFVARTLDRQLALYAAWIAGRREDVLRLDNAACGPAAVRRLLSAGRSG
jgi:deoxyadenosine/deoxycytidine kinase